MTETPRTSHRPATLPTALLRRWPTAAALTLGAAAWGLDAASAGQMLSVLPAVYVVVAVLKRRSSTWPTLAGSFAVLVALQVQTLVEPAVAVLALASAVALVGFGHRAGRSELGVQVAGLLVFGGLALTGLVVAPEMARYTLAAAWLGHGLWDLVHLRRDAVVSRSYAEFCGVIDLVIAGSLLAGP